MPHYVYIIESLADCTYYKGETADPVQRLRQHNEGLNTSTVSKRPWRFVYVLDVEKRSAALKEHSLKRANKVYPRWLLQQQKNLALDKTAQSFSWLLYLSGIRKPVIFK